MNRENAIRPIVLGIGGDSGSGKTTIARGISRIFGPENILNISLDDYHVLDREARRRARVTALDPVANDISLMEEHIWALREGRSIEKPIYDHTTGTLRGPETVAPRPIVVIRGLHPFFTERLRQAFDLRVWLDPDEELKYHWKIQRDVAERGYTVESVIRQIVERQDDLRRYILPQREHADLVVRFYPSPGYFRAKAEGRLDDAHLNVRVVQRRTLPLLDLADVLEVAWRTNGHAPALRLVADQLAGDVVEALEIDGDVAPEIARQLEDRIWDHMDSHRYLRPAPEELGTYLERGSDPRHSDPLALTQLLIACRLAAVRDALTAVGSPVPVPRRA